MKENAVIKVLLSRRSVRAYQPRELERSMVDIIVETGRYAPSGGNSQTTKFIVIRSREVLDRLQILVESEFAKMEVSEGMYKSIRASITASKRGGYRFCYDAPVLVVLANKKEYGNAMADCSAAAENMLVAAHALGIGACWINQLKWLGENENVRAFMDDLGLNEDDVICAGVSLGYSAEGEKKPLERTGNEVIYIE